MSDEIDPWVIKLRLKMALDDGARLTAVEARDLEAHLVHLAKQVADLAEEEETSYKVIARQGALLTGVVNAIRGEPPSHVLWSHHDVPDLARALKAELLKLREALRVAVDCVKADRPALDMSLYDALLKEPKDPIEEGIRRSQRGRE